MREGEDKLAASGQAKMWRVPVAVPVHGGSSEPGGSRGPAGFQPPQGAECQCPTPPCDTPGHWQGGFGEV